MQEPRITIQGLDGQFHEFKPGDRVSTIFRFKHVPAGSTGTVQVGDSGLLGVRFDILSVKVITIERGIYVLGVCKHI